MKQIKELIRNIKLKIKLKLIRIMSNPLGHLIINLVLGILLNKIIDTAQCVETDNVTQDNTQDNSIPKLPEIVVKPTSLSSEYAKTMDQIMKDKLSDYQIMKNKLSDSNLSGSEKTRLELEKTHLELAQKVVKKHIVDSNTTSADSSSVSDNEIKDTTKMHSWFKSKNNAPEISTRDSNPLTRKEPLFWNQSDYPVTPLNNSMILHYYLEQHQIVTNNLKSETLSDYDKFRLESKRTLLETLLNLLNNAPIEENKWGITENCINTLYERTQVLEGYKEHKEILDYMLSRIDIKSLHNGYSLIIINKMDKTVSEILQTSVKWLNETLPTDTWATTTNAVESIIIPANQVLQKLTEQYFIQLKVTENNPSDANYILLFQYAYMGASIAVVNILHVYPNVPFEAQIELFMNILKNTFGIVL